MRNYDKVIGAISLLVLIGCEAPTAPSSQAPEAAQQENTPTRSVSEGTRAYERVAKRVRPIAVRLCRQENERRPESYCNFRIVVDPKSKGGPNAYQTIGKDGRPILAFNQAMLQTIRNDHEIAFILGHEAGHQINSHISKQRTTANLGALVLGGLVAGLGGTQAAVSGAQNIGGVIGARAYSKDHEIEADIVGTYIATLSGYDPAIGAKSFARFGGGSRSFLSTHPPSSDRQSAVTRTVSEIASKRAAGQPLTLP